MPASRRAAWPAVAVVALWLAGCELIPGVTVQSAVRPATMPPPATLAPATETTAPERPTSTAMLAPAIETAAPERPTSTAISTAAAEAAEAAIPALIALSAGGRPINSYRLGHGTAAVVVVGGIHGGYEWNSILLAERLLAHYEAHPAQLPDGVSLHIIPNANPDGLFAILGFEGPFTPADVPVADPIVYLPGRFNANGVDLNRNWDCQWTSAAQWRDRQVSGGPFAFSEPETRGLRDFLPTLDPVVVVFLHSAANAVFISGCGAPHPPSYEPASVYGRAAGYPVHELFDPYVITGDAGDWLTTQGIPSFSVELYSHESVDWEQNLAGIGALLAHYAQQPATPIAAPTAVAPTPKVTP